MRLRTLLLFAALVAACHPDTSANGDMPPAIVGPPPTPQTFRVECDPDDVCTIALKDVMEMQRANKQLAKENKALRESKGCAKLEVLPPMRKT